MAATGLFVTGTDTGCGKTEITLALMRLYQDLGLRVLGMKPVASGCERAGAGLFNEDALRIQDAGSLAVPYELVNPYAFEPPIAPHIAAEESRTPIRSQVIQNCFDALAELADLVIVEGVGGWRVPLASDLDLSELPGLLRIPAVLVVGLRLGCINHSVLSADCIMEKGCGFAGWIANRIDPAMLRVAENLAALDGAIPAPRLGLVEHMPNPRDSRALVPMLDRTRLSALVAH